jgi:enoyl-CoA hydratase
MIDANEALRIGLVDKVVPHDKLMEEAKKIAKNIASKGQVAIRLAKSAINNGINADLHTGCSFEIETFGVCFSTEDQKEGMKAFLEKKKPAFKGK